MKSRRRVLLLILGTLWPAVGCERPPSTPPTSQPTTLLDWVIHPAIVESERDVPPPRILSAAPNMTEICCALGLSDALVGRTRYCTYPPTILSVPSIGDLYNLNVEVLLSLKPDLILVSGRSRALADRLNQLGLRYEALPDDSLNDLFIAIERTGELTHHPQTAATLIQDIHNDLDEVARRFANEPPRRVLLLTGPLSEPPREVSVAGPGSFYDDLLRRAGHTNVADITGRPFSPMSLEYIVRADPDVIIELAPDASARPHGDADALRAWAQLGSLRAVRDRNVHVLVGEQYFVLGPRIAMTFEALCATIARHD